MKNLKSISYGLIVGLAFGGAVSAIQAVPPLTRVGNLAAGAFYFLRDQYNKFRDPSGDKFLRDLTCCYDFFEHLDKEVPSQHDGGPYSWDVIAKRQITLLRKFPDSYSYERSSNGGSDDFHKVHMSLSGRCSWFGIKLEFVDRRIAEDVRKRIEQLADKKNLKVEDLERGGLEFKDLADLSKWMVAQEVARENKKRIEPGQLAIEKGLHENGLIYQQPEIRRKIMRHVFELEEAEEAKSE